MFVQDQHGNYLTKNAVTKQEIIEFAYYLLTPDFISNTKIESSADCADYLRLALSNESHECFGIVFLTAAHQVIEFEIICSGTLNVNVVYPRSVVTRVLDVNAQAVILAHNHPSRNITPSQPDFQLTASIQAALKVIDVQVLDHIIVGGDRFYSFADHGKLNGGKHE